MSKVVLITGASSGIGKATAIRLKKAGFTVYGAARRIERLENLKVFGINTLYMDVTVDETMVKGVQEIIDKEGKIDILINNAGYGSYGALEDVSMEEAKYQFDVNIFGLARLIQLVLPYMRKNKRGKIINISSIGGKIYMPMGSWYHSTKFALEGLSNSLRLEVKEFGIDVIVIEPGATLSEWSTIAINNLMKTSKHTIYENMAQKTSKLFAFMKNGKLSAKPDDIAKEIQLAIMKKHPKNTYIPTMSAKSILLARKFLSDKTFDNLILMIMNKF
jgi:short-subunit dehydrogenase